MPMQDMRAFVTKYKPKVVHAIVAERQADYGRLAVQPCANTVNTAARKPFNHNKTNTCLAHQTSDVARLLGRLPHKAHCCDCVSKPYLRVGRSWHLPSNGSHSMEPNKLFTSWGATARLAGCMSGAGNAVQTVDPEESAQLSVRIPARSRVINPSALYHFAKRIIGLRVGAVPNL